MSALDDASGAVDLLEKEVYVLTEKLACALFSAPEQAGAAENRGPVPPTSELRARIDAIAGRIRQIRSNVASLVSRLDV